MEGEGRFRWALVELASRDARKPRRVEVGSGRWSSNLWDQALHSWKCRLQQKSKSQRWINLCANSEDLLKLCHMGDMRDLYSANLMQQIQARRIFKDSLPQISVNYSRNSTQSVNSFLLARQRFKGCLNQWFSLFYSFKIQEYCLQQCQLLHELSSTASSKADRRIAIVNCSMSSTVSSSVSRLGS